MQASYLPIPIQFNPNSWNDVQNNKPSFNAQTQVQQQGPLNGPVLHVNPPDMPELSRHCPGCSKTYDQLAVETLTHYVVWLEYPKKPSKIETYDPVHSCIELVRR